MYKPITDPNFADKYFMISSEVAVSYLFKNYFIIVKTVTGKKFIAIPVTECQDYKFGNIIYETKVTPDAMEIIERNGSSEFPEHYRYCRDGVFQTNYGGLWDDSDPRQLFCFFKVLFGGDIKVTRL